jgi:tripartite-type tricarboxylate transporter receptor subunit TctC
MFKKIILSIAYLCATALASAESVKVYDVIVPFSAGGASDVLFRAIEPELNQRLQKHQIKLIVRNVPGAGGSIGLSKVKDSDSLTFGFFSPFFAINKNMRTDYQYDFDSVNFLNFAGFNKMLIISGKHSSLADLKTECLKNKTISFGSSGVGSTSHLSAYYFATKYLNCKDILSVPYKGVSSVYPDLKAGRIDFMADFAIAADNFIESKYFNHIEDLKETDLVSWHVFVSSKVKNPDAEIVKKVFDSIKADKKFTKDLESRFQIYKFSENKDSAWLKQQFGIYKTVIDTLPKATTEK